MTIVKINKPYREAAGLMVLNSEREIFVGHRIDTKSEAWQMPQGGIDWGETPIEAAYRELWEETGITEDKVELIRESEDWYHYELPQHLADTLWRGRYRGQKQKWFAFDFIGEESDINIQTKRPEFSQWKWERPENLADIIVPFKQELYSAVLTDFDDILKGKA